jgi:anaerobic selenocysteine-containing dehydrogenase
VIRTVRTACAHDCPDQCSIIATVEDGRLLKLQGDPDHPVTSGFLCAKVNREHELVHSPERVLRPLRRVGPKGEGRFAPVSWDEALGEIVERWQRIIAADGPLALLGYAYSAHQGQLNRGLVLGLFHALGATRLQAGTVCDTCAEAGWDAACGSVGGSDPESVVESDLVISWGADLLTTNLHIWPLVERARAKGAPLVVIEPRRSATAARADWHLRVNVGTDAALALGVMHMLARDGLCDRAYLARETLGFDRLEREVLPRFTRVAEVTGVSVADLERLARMYGRARAPFIRLGEGMSRCTNGGQAIRAVALLPGVVGAYAKRGGGALLMTATGFGFDASAIRKPSGPAISRMVNHSRLGEALLTMKEPPIRALFVAANNPAVTCPDAAAVRRGLAREDLFTVVHDPFLSDTARYADLVLPAATHYESEDVVRAYGTFWMQFIPQVVPPQGEAWSNRRLAQELARRLGVKDAVFSMDTDGLVRAFFRNARGPAAAVDPATLRTAGAIKVANPIAVGPGQPFGTPSKRLEFYSESLATQGLPAMPDWVAGPEDAAGPRYPLRLLTAPGYFQAHTAYAGVAALRKKAGPPECVLHPDDAAARGLRAGAPVELFNEQGAVTFVLRVSDETPRGVAFVPGQRPAGEAHAGTINMLCSTTYSDLGEGATYQSTRLDARAPRRA